MYCLRYPKKWPYRGLNRLSITQLLLIEKYQFSTKPLHEKWHESTDQLKGSDFFLNETSYKYLSLLRDQYDVNVELFRPQTNEKSEIIKTRQVPDIRDSPYLDKRIRQNLKEANFYELTLLQQHLISLLLPRYHKDDCSVNVIISGNVPSSLDSTLAYLMPMLNHICRFYPEDAINLMNENERRIDFPSALVLVPSEKKSICCYEEAVRLLSRTPVVALRQQLVDRKSKSHLQAIGANLVVGTPDAILRSIEIGTVSLKACRHLVIEDVDLMYSSNMYCIHGLLRHSNGGLSSASSSSAILFMKEPHLHSSPFMELFNTLLELRPSSGKSSFLVSVTSKSSPTNDSMIKIKSLESSSPMELDETEVVEYSLKPGYVSLETWFERRSKPRSPLLRDEIFKTNRISSSVSVDRIRGWQLHLMNPTLQVQQSTRVAFSMKPIKEIDNLDYRIRSNLAYMKCWELNCLEQTLFELFNSKEAAAQNTQEELACKKRIVIYGASFGPCLNAVTNGYLLSLLNELTSTYPSRAMELLVENEFQCQFPTMVVLLSSMNQCNIAAQQAERLKFNTRIRSAETGGFNSSIGLTYGFHALFGTPNQILSLIESGLVSLKACRHFIVNYGQEMKSNAVMNQLQSILSHTSHGLCLSNLVNTLVIIPSIELEDHVRTFMKMVSQDEGLDSWIQFTVQESHIQSSELNEMNDEVKKTRMDPHFITEIQWKQKKFEKLNEQTIFRPEEKQFYQNIFHVYRSDSFHVVDQSDSDNQLASSQETYPLDERLQRNLRRMGITNLSPLQCQLLSLQSKSTSSILLCGLSSTEGTCLTFVLHALNSLMTKYPANAMKMMRKHNFQIQYPSVVLLLPSLVKAYMCINELNWMKYNSLVSTFVMKREAAVSPKQFILSTPANLLGLIKQGNISLSLCEHVIAAGLATDDENMELLERMMRHPAGGLLTSTCRRSSLVVSAEGEVKSDLQVLANCLHPHQNVELSRDDLSTSVIKLKCHLPSEGVRYAMKIFSNETSRLKYLSSIVKEFDNGVNHILVIWHGPPRPDLWRSMGIHYFFVELSAFSDGTHFTETCEAFNRGDFRVLLLTHRVLKCSNLRLPNVSVLVHVGLSSSRLNDFVRIHRVLLGNQVMNSQRNSTVKLSVLLLNDAEYSHVPIKTLWEDSKIELSSSISLPNT